MITKDEIKQLRADRGWTQKELADQCGVSVRSVENWEQQRTGISKPAMFILKGLIKKTANKKLREKND